MRFIKQHFLPLCLLLSIPLLNLIYSALNHGEHGARQLITVIDRKIPFLEIFIIPYLVWYGYIFIMFVLFCIFDKRIYYRTLLSFTVGMLICYTIYFFFQTTVPRPEVLGDGVLSSLVINVYGADKPFNCFPSIHVLSSYLMIAAIRRSTIWTIKREIAVWIISTSIILSTFFVKQHVILDAVAAILLGNILFKLFYYIEPASSAAFFKRLFKSKKATES